MFFRCILLPFLVLAAAGVATAQRGFDLSNYGVRVEPDKRVIAVLATLEMAEITDQSGKTQKLVNTALSKKGSEFRATLLADNAALDPDLKRRIGQFVFSYKKRDPKASDADTVAPFVSMAYTLSPAPDLANPSVTADLPGSLLDVLDFAPLVREFYRRSTLSAKIDSYVKDYRSAADGVLRDSAREMVSELLDYLHTRPQLFVTEKVKVAARKSKGVTLEKTETRTHERRFFIVPEMLAPQGNVTFLNARDDYYIILPPDKDVSFSEARRGFLQFVVDPLVLANSREAAALREWAKARLDDRRKAGATVSPDALLAASRSLAAAIDVRQIEFAKGRIATQQARQKLAGLKTDEEKRAVTAELEKFKQTLADETALQLSEDFDKGLVLVFFFADKLREIEDSGFDIAASLRELLASFDPAAETARLADAAAARQRAIAARVERQRDQDRPGVIAENPVTTRLIDIQKLIDAKEHVKAAAELRALARQFPADARVYYNLGRVAGLMAATTDDPDEQARNLLEAKAAYENVVTRATAETDKALRSLAYVALARIYEHFDDAAYAIKLYDEAIKLDDVAGGAFREAIAGKQRLLKRQ